MNKDVLKQLSAAFRTCADAIDQAVAFLPPSAAAVSSNADAGIQAVGKRSGKASRSESVQYGSPLDPTAADFLPPGWVVSLYHGHEYGPRHNVPPNFIGQVHTGVDLNRADNRDEGLPVYAVADGVVHYAGKAPGSWGNLLVLRHADAALSRYAHLKHMTAFSKGQQVKRGARVGTVGRGANNQFDAHLHFDMIYRSRLWDAQPWYWSGRRHNELKHYVDPIKFINERGWWRA